MVYVLLLYAFFSLFFLFDSRYVKTLNELKYVNYTDSIYTYIILLFLSFAGIPPLLGFCSKFFLFILFISKTNIAILVFFTIFNFFSMYFYVQNLRFLVAKEPKYFYIFKNNYVFWNKSVLMGILILNFLNVFGITFIDDIMIYIHALFTYVY